MRTLPKIGERVFWLTVFGELRQGTYVGEMDCAPYLDVRSYNGRVYVPFTGLL